MEATMKKLSPVTTEKEVAKTLVNAGLTSTQQISRYSQKNFVEKYAQLFTEIKPDMAQQFAAELHQKAQAHMGRLVHQHVDTQQRSSAYYRNFRFANFATPAAQNTGDNTLDPSYEGQFGVVNATEVDPDRSVLSPAAYLADLVWLADQHIHQKPGDHAASISLDERRPDIKNITLNSANTNTMISKLNIVNDVLMQQLGADFCAQDLVTQSFPFNLPYHQPLDQIRTYLKQHNTSLPQLWLGLIDQPTVIENKSIAIETLGLSPEQWLLVSTPNTDADELKQYYGLGDDLSLTCLQNTSTFKQQTNITEAQLQELLKQDLTSGELENQVNENFFINIGQSAPICNHDGQLTFSDGTVALDRIHRFIRLAKWLNWSFTDLDWVLRATYSATNQGSLEDYDITDNMLPLLAWVKTVESTGILTINQACAYLYQIKTYGENALLNDLEQLLNNTNVSQRFTLRYQSALAKESISKEQKQVLQAVLQLSQQDLQIILDIAGDIDDPLSLENFSTLYRISLLPRIYALSLEDCMSAYALKISSDPQQDYQQNTLLTEIRAASNFGPEQSINGTKLLSIIGQLTDTVLWFTSKNIPIQQTRYWLTGSSNSISIQNTKPGLAKLTNNINAIQTALAKHALTAVIFEENTPAVTALYSGIETKISDYITNNEDKIIQELVKLHLDDSLAKALVDGLQAIISFGVDIALECNPIWIYLSERYLSGQGIFNAIPEKKKFEAELTRVLSICKITPSDTLLSQCWNVFNRYAQAQVKAIEQQLSSITALVPEQLNILCRWLDIVPSDFQPESDLNTPTKQQVNLLNRLARFADLISSFNLSTAELLTLYRNPSYFVTEPARLNFELIQSLVFFKELLIQCQDSHNHLLDYLDAVNNNTADASDLLTALTGWNINILGMKLETNLPKNIPQLEHWSRYVKALRLLDIDVAMLDLLIAIPISEATDSDFESYQKLAAALWAGLQSQYHDQSQLLTDMQNTLSDHLRDALVPAAIEHLNNTQNTSIANGNDLYEYLLIDVNVDAVVETSRISEAITAVQLFVYRCLNHLEVGFEVDQQLHQWWPWIQHYRVWQDNREVFLYPENYIQPELRKNKSDLFEQLENHLQQGNLSDTETTESSLFDYMAGLSPLANLAIESTAAFDYAHTLGSSTACKNLFLLGKTNESCPQYYYLNALFTPSKNQGYAPLDWGQWQSIDLSMQPIGTVNTVYGFGKWFIFWVEKNQSGADTSQNPITQTYQYLLKYSFLDASNNWQPAHVLATEATEDTAVDLVYFHSNETIYVSWNKTQYQVSSNSILSQAQGAARFAAKTLTNSDNVVDNIYEMANLPLSLDAPGGDATKSLSVWFKADTNQEFDVCNNGSVFKIDENGNSLVNGDSIHQHLDISVWNHVLLNQQALTNIGTNTEVNYLSNIITLNGCQWVAWSADSQLYVSQIIEDNDGVTLGKARPLLNVERNVSPLNNFLFNRYSLAVFNQYLYITWSGQDDNEHYWLNVARLNIEADEVEVIEQKEYDSSDSGSGLRVTSDSASAPALISYNGQLVVAWLSLSKTTTTHESRLHMRCVAGENGDLLPSITDTQYTNSKIYGGSPSLTVSYNEDGTEVLHCAIASDREPLCIDLYSLNDITDLNSQVPTKISLKNAVKVKDNEVVKYIEVSKRIQLAYDFKAKDLVLSWADDENIYYQYTAQLMDGNYAFNLAKQAQSGLIFGASVDGLSALILLGNSPTSISCWNTNIYLNGCPVLSPQISSLEDIKVGFSDNGEAGAFGGALQEVLAFSNVLSPSQCNLIYANSNQHFSNDFDIGLDVSSSDLFSSEQVETITVNGQPNWAVYQMEQGNNSAPSSYLCLPSSSNIINTDTGNSVVFTALRLNAPLAVKKLEATLALEGIDGFYTLGSQLTSDIPFSSLSPDINYFPNYPSTTLDFNQGPMGNYFAELFFHIPFLIAHQLQTAQQFEPAKSWFEFIFNPCIHLSADERDIYGDTADKYWRFLGLRCSSNKVIRTEHGLSLQEELLVDSSDSNQLAIYHYDPFDPHAIAALRPIAYQKTIVMHYINNLLDYADSLFRQYTSESISEATLYYTMAYDLLGEQPEAYHRRIESGGQTLADFEQELAPSSATEPVKQQGTSGSPLLTPLMNNSIISSYFGIPENQQLISYWQTIANRLFNIRHELNINGQFETISAFAPAIDPMQLVAGVASGETVEQAIAATTSIPPYYKFQVTLGKAKELTQLTMQFGQSLLAALEKKDAEALSLLYNSNQQNILALTRTINDNQLNAAIATSDSLEASLSSAQARYDYYDGLIAANLSPKESKQVSLGTHAAKLQASAQPLKTGGEAAACLIPTVFGLADGGQALAQGASIPANVMESKAQVLSMQSGDMGTQAGFERRAQDWQLQKTLAQNDINQIADQLLAARYQQAVAQQQITVLEKNIEQEQKVAQFLKNKFTNQELYQWYSAKLSTLYFQTYQLAMKVAQQAELAWQFEKALDITTPFIQSNYWYSQYQGIGAGDALMLDLHRMEQAYMESDSRALEIRKIISLNALDEAALAELKSSGKCNFSLTEADLDLDYPGHYRRQINTLTVTLPAVIAPYQNLCATLTQTANKVLLKDDIQGIKYLLGKSQQSVPQVRENWMTNQQIAVSQGVNDSGMITVNFGSERYLPFQGTGAVSDWELEIPSDSNPGILASLSDVIIELHYTAYPGNSSFKNTVQQLLKQQTQ